MGNIFVHRNIVMEIVTRFMNYIGSIIRLFGQCKMLSIRTLTEELSVITHDYDD